MSVLPCKGIEEIFLEKSIEEWMLAQPKGNGPSRQLSFSLRIFN
jgi:hypothetical protein